MEKWPQPLDIQKFDVPWYSDPPTMEKWPPSWYWKVLSAMLFWLPYDRKVTPLLIFKSLMCHGILTPPFFMEKWPPNLYGWNCPSLKWVSFPWRGSKFYKKNLPRSQTTIWNYHPGVNIPYEILTPGSVFHGGQNTIWHRYFLVTYSCYMI